VRVKQVTALSRNLIRPTLCGHPRRFRGHLELMPTCRCWPKLEVTRTPTLMFARETQRGSTPHRRARRLQRLAYSNERKNMDQFAVINRYHVKMLGLQRLRHAGRRQTCLTT
jgi:hypothetical protein